VNERNCGVEGCKRKNKNKFMKKKTLSNVEHVHLRPKEL
jgi:hypothetical protein